MKNSNNIIDFIPKLKKQRFTITASKDVDHPWMVSIDEFYDSSLSPSQMFEEIAEALVPIAGGLVHGAEEMEPTTRGTVVSNIMIFSSGIIEFHSEKIDTKKRKAWFADAIDRVRAHVVGKKRKA